MSQISSKLRIHAYGVALLLTAATGTGLSAAEKYPDAAKLAFSVAPAEKPTASRIFVANPDGSAPRPVTQGVARDSAPAFSPDGTQLAYQSTDSLGLDRIVVQPIDGSRPPRVVATGSSPQWSRDGRRILFSRRQFNDYQLFVIRSDGSQQESGLKPLTPGVIGRWSPDEKWLATVSPTIAGGRDRWEVSVFHTDGLKPRLTVLLPESYGQVVSLDWSPNAESLLFSVTQQGSFALYRLDLKAPQPRRLPAKDEDRLAFPNAAYGAWSPDGEHIVFRSSSTAPGAPQPGTVRLCQMKADGTEVRTLWDAPNSVAQIHGASWFRPTEPEKPQQVAQNPAPKPKPDPVPVKPEPQPKPEPLPVKPEPKPEPKVEPQPEPMPAPEKVLSEPVKLHSSKVFNVTVARSPVSVKLAQPGAADFIVSVPVSRSANWATRRQGVGLTLELEDGSLYRGNLIYNGGPWVTIQGRPKDGKVRLIDAKQLPAATGFRTGFKLTLQREGTNLVLLVNDQEILRRPVLSAPVSQVQLTLENFDPGAARFPLGNIYYREWQLPEGAPKQNANQMLSAPPSNPQ